MTTRKRLAALLANEQVRLPEVALERLDALARDVEHLLMPEREQQGGGIHVGMDWSTLEVGRLYNVPAQSWRGDGSQFSDDANSYMRAAKEPRPQFQFGGNEMTGFWVQRTR